MARKDIRRKILDTVSDLVARFLYYDRKEDEDLPRGKIEEAIKGGKISAQDIVAEFKKELEDGLSED